MYSMDVFYHESKEVNLKHRFEGGKGQDIAVYVGKTFETEKYDKC